MANLYDITNHPLLSDDAQALGATSLDAQGRVAETLLGLLDFTAFDQVTQADLYARATDAVALQVSYQVDSGVDAFILSQMTKGGRSITFRGGRRMPIIHGLAKKLISKIKPTTTGLTGR